MPELPEVETVLRTLELRIKGKKIENVEVLWKNIIIGDVEHFKKTIIGQHFNGFKRRGKYLIFELDTIALVSHLRMEGKYYLEPKCEPLTKHIHVLFNLEDIDMRYHDTRKFGKMELIPLSNDYKVFKTLGVEPFSKEFNVTYCAEYLKKSQKPIKSILLDQQFIAGIGNIYADEILFKMKTHPERKGATLCYTEIKDLVTFTNETLKEAIEKGGTTIRSYTSSLKVTGLFQLELLVHTKVNQPCSICHNLIKKIKVQTRGTYYCEHCQK